MELRRVVWAWETALVRLAEREPSLGRAARRSCRPLAAERRVDGRLTLTLASWWPPDLHELRVPASISRLDAALSEFLDDQVRTTIVAWPGGMAPPEPGPDPDEVSPPDLLAGLPPEAREQASACESALQRLFFAQAWRQGLRLVCQHPVLNYRLDFAAPRDRVGVEIIGWEGPRPGRTDRWEREQQLGAESWRILYFSGQEVHSDVDRCVQALARAVRGSGARSREPGPA